MENEVRRFYRHGQVYTEFLAGQRNKCDVKSGSIFVGDFSLPPFQGASKLIVCAPLLVFVSPIFYFVNKEKTCTLSDEGQQ